VEDWTDYDSDGVASYDDRQEQAVRFWEATKAIDRSTLAVEPRRSRLEAIAYAGGGIYINVPGGSTVGRWKLSCETRSNNRIEGSASELVYNFRKTDAHAASVVRQLASQAFGRGYSLKKIA
jgi:hypothetical protein